MNLKLGYLLFFSFFIRLLIILLSSSISNFDLESYKYIGTLTLHHTAIYPSPADLHHPYFPFFLYLEALAVWIHVIPSGIVVRLISILFDLGGTYLVYLLSKKNLSITALYAFNPITTLILSFHGQFDSIPIFFLLLSVYCIEKKNSSQSALSFSVAIMTKTWPLLFGVPFLKRLPKKQLLLILLFPLISIVVYAVLFHSSIVSILKVVEGYRGLFGIWGIGALFHLLTGIATPHGTRFLRIIFLAIFLLFSLRIRKQNILTELLLLLLFFYSFTFALAVQYFSWIMPFLLLTRPRLWKPWMSVITIFLLIYYAAWIMWPYPKMISSEYNTITLVVGLVAWIMTVFVLFKNVHLIWQKRLPDITFKNTGV